MSPGLWGVDALDSCRSGEAYGAARRGEVVVVRGAGQATGILPTVERVIFDSIETAAGSAAADAARAAGLEQLHHHVTVPQLHDAFRLAEARLARDVVDLARSLLGLTNHGDARCGYVCGRVWVRFHVPLSVLREWPEIAELPYVTGHLAPAPPHRDTDLTHPRGTLSYWMAVGPALEGNSVRIWPDRFVDRGPAGESADPAGAVAPALAPGDLLLFDTGHVHATVPNETDQTRVAITVRVAPRPLRYGAGAHWRPFIDLRLADTPLRPLATARSYLSPAYVRRRRALRARRTLR